MLKRGIEFGFSVLMLLFAGSGCGFDPSRLLPEQTMAPLSPAIAERTISHDLGDRLIWRKNRVSIRQLLPSPGLLAGHGYVAYVNFLGGPLSMINQMDILEATTGAPVWQSARFPTHEDMAISKDRAFVLLRRGSPLNIFDIRGGSEPLYSVNYFNQATKFYLFPSSVEKDIYLYYVEGDQFSVHRLDLTGKEVVAPRSIPAPNTLSDLFLFDQPFFLSTGEEYTGGDFETGKELWHIPAPGRIDSWPVLQNNTLIISAGDGKRYVLMAIDVQNGREVWKTDKVFGSNVVLYKNDLYALRNDAVLVRLALTTGQVLEEMPFSPPSIDGGLWAYCLASDENGLFVYFGDSQELFAFNLP